MKTDQRTVCLNSLDNSYSISGHSCDPWGTLEAGADNDWQADLY